MRVLFSTVSPAQYMLPPQLGDEQINCGPDWTDERAPDGRVRSLATPIGEYDLATIAAKLPPEQAPDLVVCLVDASWRNVPRNLGAFRCPRVLLIADTHHLRSPLLGMLRYMSAEPFERVVFLYDRHHAAFFHAAGFRNLYWFPGLTFPHADTAVRRARAQGARAPRIAFVGQAGKHHPRRARLMEALISHQLPVVQKALPQAGALDFYGTSLLGFNASLNGDLNLRVFEIMAAGGALLTDRLAPDAGLTQLLTDGQEVLTYGSPDELVERAAAAVADPVGTKALGAAGARWFDRHLSAPRRRAAFRALAFDGTPVPEFDFSVEQTTRVFFGGDTDRLLQGLVVYEQVQEQHRVQEQVRVATCEGVAPDVAVMFSTLPRIATTAAPTGEEADLTVFSRDAAITVPAPRVWCWDAQETDTAALAERLRPEGFLPVDQSVAFFARSAGKPPVRAAAPGRLAALLVLARVALQARDYALCRETLATARRLGGDPKSLEALAAELAQASAPVDDALCPAGA